MTSWPARWPASVSASRMDTLPLTDWLLENSGGLVSELPFLLEIPAERILGGE